MPYIGVSPFNGVRRKHTYTATANQTSFSGAGTEGATLSYTDSTFVDVYQNGVKLGEADYTATSGTAIVLGQGASLDDLVEIVIYDVFSVADTVSKSAGGTFDGNLTAAGTLAVTGAITSSAGATITTADNTAQLTIISTDADANSGPEIDLHRNSASPDDGDILGRLRFQGENDADEKTQYAAMFVKAADVTNGTEDALLRFDSIINGGNAQRLEFNATEAVFNEGSADIDLRVESNASANALFVDGGANRVGIGTATPSNPLTVVTSTDGSGVSGDNVFAALIHNAEATNDASKGLLIKAGTTTADQAFDVQDHDGSNQYFRILGNGDVCISRTASLSNGRVSVDFSSAADNGFCINDTASGNGAAFINFHTGGTSRGAITNNNNSAVAYNTSSDYRLKENVSYSFDATTELKKLKPCKFNFIGGDLTVEGFLAHEVQAVVPQAITGTHNEVDDDDNPVYQGIDQSKLVPLLVKTILELEARITALEG